MLQLANEAEYGDGDGLDGVEDAEIVVDELDDAEDCGEFDFVVEAISLIS